MQKKILIIEDDDDAYHGMEEALHREAVARDEATMLIRATSLTGAKRALRDNEFHVISVDMVLPSYDGEARREARAGALFIHYLKFRRSTPHLLYSSSETEESLQTLKQLGINWHVPVYKKDSSCGHKTWAKALLDL